MKRLTNAVHSFLRAGVPRRTAVAAASTVGAMGSFTTLALAYREPLNRCRCDATTSERVEDDADEPEEPRDEARTKAKTKKKKSKSPFRAHCPKCRKRTNAGVALSFLFSPLYVAIASGITAAAAPPPARGRCVWRAGSPRTRAPDSPPLRARRQIGIHTRVAYSHRPSRAPRLAVAPESSPRALSFPRAFFPSPRRRRGQEKMGR